MYQCRRCGSYADAGELRAGICEDCITEEREEEYRRDCNLKMLAMCIAEQKDGQMVMVG